MSLARSLLRCRPVPPSQLVD
ncbi:hypothetical protein CCACVL1_19914 [Corchorus capsularis]|uniref:Uncharacterized protein n=1 Tax=Corchorus capsularis TaxID=210143 RepID=A0A1R3HDZ8_COCAP|nr:hypothetical protein CCACVL1_19914 [Corchorus capsularis]